MTRQEKYPNTKTFTYYNRNPHNKVSGDCVVRAISFALDVPYNDLVMDIAMYQCNTGVDIRYNKEDIYLKKKFGIMKQPMLRHHDNTRYTLKEFIRRFPKGTYIVKMIHHLTVVKDGVCYDIWDCTKSNTKIGNYYIIG